MALVKKLQNGSTIDNNALNTKLGEKLSSAKLKRSDEEKVRKALTEFRDYFASGEGKSFSADELSNTYKVSGEGSQSLMGSEDEVKKA
jgi:hypothetical protein